MKRMFLAPAAKAVIWSCRVCPPLRRLYSNAHVTPNHFGSRPVRVAINGNGKGIWFANLGDTHLSYQLFWSGINYYEPFTRTLIEGLTASTDLFVDVGANIGFFSLVAATLNPRLRVVAFEPNPKIFQRLANNQRANDLTNLTAEPIALSNCEGEAKLFLNRSDMSASLVQEFQKAAQTDTVSVKVTTLDAYLQRLGFEGSLVLKVDVEGHEKAFLEGARNTLATRKPDLILEVLSQFDPEWLEEFKKLGYHFYSITDQGLSATENVTLTRKGPFAFFNYLFTTKSEDDLEIISDRMRRLGSSIDLRQTSKLITHQVT